MEQSHFTLRDEFRTGLREYAVAKSYPAGARIFQRGDPMDGVYMIREGHVSVSLADVPALKPRILGPGALLGLPSTIGARPYSLTAVAVEQVEADFVPREQFMMLLAQYADFCLAVLKGLAREIAELRDEESRLLEQHFGERAGR